MAVDKVIVEYQLKTDQLKKELEEVKKEIGGVDAAATKSGNNLSATFLKVGGAIAAAFSVQQIIQFTARADELARKAEGVERAFNKLNDPNLLNKLREATQGAVSDLDLMQSAVRSSKFKIPLEQLAKMFAFAAQRARETGESVDYLVESIVDGVGKKSLDKLDNLGLGITQVKAEFEKTGDIVTAVGNVIDQEMGKAEGSTYDMALAADRAKANLENLTLEIGKRLTPALTTLRVGLNAAIESVIDLFDPAFITQREAAVQSTEDMILRIEKAGVISQVAQGRIDRFNEKISDLDTQLKNTTNVKARQELINQLTAFGKAMIAVNEEDAAQSLAATDKGMRAAGLGIQQANSFIANYLSTLDAGEETQEKFNKKLETSNQIIDRLYPPTTALTKALMEMGQAFAYVRTENMQGIETFFDVERAAIALLDDASGFPALKQSIVEYVDTMALARAENRDFFDSLTLGLSAAEVLFGTYGQLLTDTANKQSAVADFGRQLAFFEIASAQAVAVANAVKLVSASAKTPVDYFIFLATLLSSIGASIGKAKGLIEGANAPKFAKGVVDLQGEGTETSDSIWARLSKGESVITAKGTKQDKGLFKAANKMQLQEYINQNYVLPMMLRKEGEKQSAFDDYRLYLAMMNNQKAVKEGSKQVVDAIKRRSRRYDWN